MRPVVKEEIVIATMIEDVLVPRHGWAIENETIRRENEIATVSEVALLVVLLDLDHLAVVTVQVETALRVQTKMGIRVTVTSSSLENTMLLERCPPAKFLPYRDLRISTAVHLAVAIRDRLLLFLAVLPLLLLCR